MGDTRQAERVWACGWWLIDGAGQLIGWPNVAKCGWATEEKEVVLLVGAVFFRCMVECRLGSGLKSTWRVEIVRPVPFAPFETFCSAGFGNTPCNFVGNPS